MSVGLDPSAATWATSADEQCVSVCFMRDDHWGKVPQRCERVAGHTGPHATGLRACEPKAVMCWPDAGVDWDRPAPSGKASA